jgi:methionine-rich copper-binding protein CopC
MMRRTTTRIVSTFAIVALVTGALVITTVSAQAHNYVLGTNPAADSVVTEVPIAFSVSTNDALLDISGAANGFAIQVTDAEGLYYGDGCGVVEGGTYSSGATLGAAGAYRFLWQVISADGHTVSEEFAFTFEPAADTIRSEGLTTAPMCGAAVVDPEPAEEPTVTPEEPTDLDIVMPISAPMNDASADFVPWIIGGIAVVVAGALATVLLLRRHKLGANVAGPAPSAPTEPEKD